MGMSDGLHTVQITLFDDQGDQCGPPASYEWTVDTTAATTTIETAAGSTEFAPERTLLLTADEEVQFLCRPVGVRACVPTCVWECGCVCLGVSVGACERAPCVPASSCHCLCERRKSA